MSHTRLVRKLAIGTSSLAVALVALTPGVSPASAIPIGTSAAAVSPQLQPAPLPMPEKESPWKKLLGAAGTAWPHISNCYKNETDNDPKTHCLTPAPSIRTVLKEIKELETRINAKFDTVNARIDALESALSYSALAADQAKLAQLQTASQQSFLAWQALVTCLEATAPATKGGPLPKGPKCKEANSTVAVDATVGMEQSQKLLISEIDALPASLGGASAIKSMFAGPQAGALTNSRGFVFNLWNLHRINQNRLVGAKDAYKTANVYTVPIVTYQLATQFNEESAVYQDIANSWAYFSILRESIVKGQADATTMSNSFGALVLNPASSGSAAFVTKGFTLPTLQHHSVLAFKNGKVKLFAPRVWHKGKVSTQMGWGAINALASDWLKYGDIALAATNMPDSVRKDREIPIKVHVKEQVSGSCTGNVWATCISSEATKVNHVNVLDDASPTVCPTYVKIENAQPTWNQVSPSWDGGIRSTWIGDVWASAKKVPDYFYFKTSWQKRVTAPITPPWFTQPVTGRPGYKIGLGSFIQCWGNNASMIWHQSDVPTPLMMAP